MKYAHYQALIVFLTKISYYDHFAPGLGQSGQDSQKLKNANMKKIQAIISFKHGKNVQY